MGSRIDCLGVSGRAAEPASIVFADRAAEPLSEAFAVQLVHRLRDQDPKVTPALAWLDERLAKQDMTADAAVREVHRSHGAANVTMRNIVTSLRVIAEVDWTELFKRICLVDDALALGGAFLEMDFTTRNLYRTAVEDWREGRTTTNSRLRASPSRSAQATHPSCEPPEQLRRSDPGYYLLAGGRREFEKFDRFSRVSGLARAGDDQTEFRRLRHRDRGHIGDRLLAAPLIALGRLGLGPFSSAMLAFLGVISRD